MKTQRKYLKGLNLNKEIISSLNSNQLESINGGCSRLRSLICTADAKQNNFLNGSPHQDYTSAWACDTFYNTCRC